MKKYCLFIFILCLSLCSCTTTKALEGKWETVALLKDDQEQTLLDSNISFDVSGIYYNAKGLAGVNLFTAFVEDKGKTISAYGMQNTGFMGSQEEMKYEDMFFDAFMNSDSYKIKKDILYFYNSEKKLELRLQKKTD